MKKILALTVLLSVFIMASAQEEYKLTASSVKIEGTSTLHNWTADVTKVSGKMTMSENGGGVNLAGVNVEMDANSIKSDKGSTMENNIYNALKAKSNPKITFQLTKVNSVSGTAADLTAVVSGNLTIAGTTKPVDLTVKGKQKANGAMEFTGSKKLKMTTFNVKPPTFMFGAMKTGDEVTITYSVTFAKQIVN